MNTSTLTSLTVLLLGWHHAGAFEGRINVSLIHGGEVQTLLYTVGTNHLRIERGESNRPYAKNLIARDTGAIMLLFPNNRSYVRLKGGEAIADARVPVASSIAKHATPVVVSEAGAAPVPPAIPGSTPFPAMPAMPPMPVMPMPTEPIELKATQDTTNLLGYACTRYELRQPGELMEIWATDQLLPFQPWLQGQPHRFGPRGIEEQWGELLKARKLFPLLAVLKFEDGPERIRFQATSVKPEEFEDQGSVLFQPPSDYQELLPFPY